MTNHSMQPYILFCEDPFDASRADPDFEDELQAAQKHGFSVILFSFDDLVHKNEIAASKRIQPQETMVSLIYRGWMLTPAQYALLYETLFVKNYKLINSPAGYKNCHYLPDSLKFIESLTPRTVFETLTNDESIDQLIHKASIFGKSPVIIKDFVKSEKHDWETACFVADASNIDKLKASIYNLIKLRDKYLNEGIVIREFIELNDLTIHSRSGMPLTEEYRLFFVNQQLVGIYNYWEEGEYLNEKPDIKVFEAVAQQIESHFFSMDIARQKDGKLIIIELGDGQVAGLPDRLDRNQFYGKLASFV